MTKWILLAGALLSFAAHAQVLSVGVKAGVPLNSGFVSAPASALSSPATATDRYIIGPELELNLPFHLGVEADALYRHYGINGNGASEWDFPLLLKYRFKGLPLVHPFVDGGVVFNRVSDLAAFKLNQSSAGIALGAGLDFHFLLLHITPELRYTRWNQSNFGSPSCSLLGCAVQPISDQNQAQFLVGFSF